MAQDEVVIVKSGRFAGQEFIVEDEVSKLGQGSDLPTIAMNGNWAAKNALEIDDYRFNDAPFYYGKINGLGYIISHNDLYGIR